MYNVGSSWEKKYLRKPEGLKAQWLIKGKSEFLLIKDQLTYHQREILFVPFHSPLFVVLSNDGSTNLH